MTFKNSIYSKQLEHKKTHFEFGKIYTTKYFVITELNEGIHVDFEIAAQLVSHFSDDIQKGKQIESI